MYKTLSILSAVVLAAQTPPSRAEADAPQPGALKKPEALKDDWRGLGELPKEDKPVAELAPSPKPRFALAAHRRLSKKGMACSDPLVAAQYRQDILRQFDARAHFDNCAFDDSVKLINEEISQIDALLSTPSKRKEAAHKAMAHIGRILHAVQDFYAHSNWVELEHARGAALDQSLVVPFWTEAGVKRLKGATDLVSGYVWWDDPKRCTSDEPTHGALAKDSPTTASGQQPLARWNSSAYASAISAAEWATMSFLRWAFERWEVLGQECGDALYVLPVSDRRPE